MSLVTNIASLLISVLLEAKKRPATRPVRKIEKLEPENQWGHIWSAIVTFRRKHRNWAFILICANDFLWPLPANQ